MPKFTSDLFDSTDNVDKTKRIYTVSQITQDIKLILENTFAEVWVEGEISGLRKIATGTVFFTMKDAASVLKCVMFFSKATAIKFEIKDGMKMICFGHIGVYEKDGQYQLYVDKIEPKGIGSLQLALEQLKEKLEKEGLFAAEHKRDMPYLPSKIGIVTSLSGAAIKDMLKVLDRRFSDVEIIISPAQVQGEGAKDTIAQAIHDLNNLNDTLPLRERIEVMIVGRGGGSIEDLWAFNEEVVARAIYSSKIPVISAVGHERDWTIADLVADLRAPTPSVAAEVVTPKKEELRIKIEDLSRSINRVFEGTILDYRGLLDDSIHRLNMSTQSLLRLSVGELEAMHKKLLLLNPVVLIQQYKAKVQDHARQIYVRMSHLVKLRQAEFTKAIEKLSSLSPLNILSRGYSITFKLPEAQIIKDVSSLKAGDRVKTRLHKGEILSQVTEVYNHGGDKV